MARKKAPRSKKRAAKAGGARKKVAVRKTRKKTPARKKAPTRKKAAKKAAARKKAPARKKAAKKAVTKKSARPRKPEAPVELRRGRPKGEIRLARPSTTRPQKPVQVRPSKSRLMMPPVED